MKLVRAALGRKPDVHRGAAAMAGIQFTRLNRHLLRIFQELRGCRTIVGKAAALIASGHRGEAVRADIDGPARKIVEVVIHSSRDEKSERARITTAQRK